MSKEKSKKEKLKLDKCPFCYATGTSIYLTPEDELLLSFGNYGWRVRCNNGKCAAIGPFRTSESKAIDAWNRGRKF